VCTRVHTQRVEYLPTYLAGEDGPQHSHSIAVESEEREREPPPFPLLPFLLCVSPSPFSGLWDSLPTRTSNRTRTRTSAAKGGGGGEGNNCHNDCSVEHRLAMAPLSEHPSPAFPSTAFFFSPALAKNPLTCPSDLGPALLLIARSILSRGSNQRLEQIGPNEESVDMAFCSF